MSIAHSIPPTDDEVQNLSRNLATLLSARILHLRNQRGWTMRTLYQRSGVSTSTQNTITNGILPDMSTILRLALTFGLDSIEEMFGTHMPTSTAFHAIGLPD